MKHLTKREVEAEIRVAEVALVEPDMRAARLWERVRVAPERWGQDQYPCDDKFWVTAILGNRCLYYQPYEGGWGWGRYRQWGTISEYHWQQDEIHHTVFQTLFAIDNGGTG